MREGRNPGPRHLLERKTDSSEWRGQFLPPDPYCPSVLASTGGYSRGSRRQSQENRVRT